MKKRIVQCPPPLARLMTGNSIKEYFDRHAALWDGYQKPEDAPVIKEILERTEVSAADAVLDAACGTGVLVPFLAKRGITNPNPEVQHSFY